METADAAVTEENDNPYNRSKKDALYPAIVQDISEILMMLSIPTESKMMINTVNDILPKIDGETLKLPDWARPLIKIS